MIKGLRRGDFVRSHPMTVVAIQAFVAIVFRVTEANSEGACRLSGACVTTELVAHAAGGDVATAGLRLRAVTLKTRDMRA